MANTKREPENENSSTSLCVLVADDDPDMREEVVRALRIDGLHVIEMQSGDLALTYLRGSIVSEGRVRVPDVIVTDIRMPGSSGLDVLRAVRQMALDIPVVLMTAFGDPITHQEARQMGATATFDKPFDADDLRTAVMCACSNRS